MPYVNQSGSRLSGVAVSGTAVSGEVPVASSAIAGVWAFPPGFEIGYDQITSQVNVVSTTEATGTAVISCAAHTFDGSPVMVEFFSPDVATPVATSVTDFVIISLFEGATQVGRLANILLANLASGQNLRQVVSSRLRFTPTAAAHTYTVTAHTNSVTGTPFVDAGAGGTGADVPAFCRFTKV